MRSLPPTMSITDRMRRSEIHKLISNGLPFSRRLKKHTSCINALAFSSGDSRWLVSGGDDSDIHLWDFHQEDISDSICSFNSPRGIIFALDFSANNRFIYSGDTRETTHKYDVERSPFPIARFDGHADSVRSVSCHPSNDDIFMSGGEDGKILVHDNRAYTSQAQATLQLDTEVTSAQYHPVLENIFLTTDSLGRVCLRDTRMAFGPLKERTGDGGIVRNFTTKLASKSVKHLADPEPSSAVFDHDGSRFAVTYQHYYPTIYSVKDPHPLAICTGRHLPGGKLATDSDERTYSNSCTIKHGSFGSLGLGEDRFYAAGSECFKGYVWQIPDEDFLLNKRVEIAADEWSSIQEGVSSPVAFLTGPRGTRYIPYEISTPFTRLRGHDSIVNTVVLHSHLPVAVTAGVESHMVVHNPTQVSPFCSSFERTSSHTRPLSVPTPESQAWMQMMLVGLDVDDYVGGGPESRTIALFDEIIRMEGEGDVFQLREWKVDDEDETEQGDTIEMRIDEDY